MKKDVDERALLKTRIQEYEKALADIATKRALWLNSAKELIYKTLQKAKRLGKLGWKVAKIEGIKNLEGVSLAFLDIPSDIVEKVLDEKTQKPVEKNYTKFGGSLIFSQTYNGDVLVLLTYPFIEGDEETPGNEIVDRISPADLTEAYILGHVASFLETMTIWESSEDEHHIGFRIGE